MTTSPKHPAPLGGKPVGCAGLAQLRARSWRTVASTRPVWSPASSGGQRKMKTSSGNSWKTRVPPTGSNPGTVPGAFRRGAPPLVLSGAPPPAPAPALSLQSLRLSGDSSSILRKGKDCCCQTHCPCIPGFVGALSPHHFSFFGIRSLAGISLLLPLPVSRRQLPAFLSGLLAPSLTLALTCGLFYAIWLFFFFLVQSFQQPEL